MLEAYLEEKGLNKDFVGSDWVQNLSSTSNHLSVKDVLDRLEQDIRDFLLLHHQITQLQKTSTFTLVKIKHKLQEFREVTRDEFLAASRLLKQEAPPQSP